MLLRNLLSMIITQMQPALGRMLYRPSACYANAWFGYTTFDRNILAVKSKKNLQFFLLSHIRLKMVSN